MMMTFLKRAVTAVFFICSLLVLGIEYKERTKTRKYEIVGICTTTRVNSYGFRVADGALRADAKELALGKTYIPLLLDHDNHVKSIVGKVTELDLRFGKTLFKAVITANEDTKSVIRKIQDGELVGISIGFTPGLSIGNILVTLDLAEISLVTVGADPGAMILSIREVK